MWCNVGVAGNRWRVIVAALDVIKVIDRRPSCKNNKRHHIGHQQSCRQSPIILRDTLSKSTVESKWLCWWTVVHTAIKVYAATNNKVEQVLVLATETMATAGSRTYMTNVEPLSAAEMQAKAAAPWQVQNRHHMGITDPPCLHQAALI